MPESSREQLVREGYDALNRHDFDWVREHAEADFTWRPNPADLEQRVEESIDEAEARARDLWSVLEGLVSEVEQVEEHGDSLLISVRHFAHGAGSGVGVERREIHVWRFSGDKVASLTEFPDIASARSSLAKSAN